MSKGKKIVGFIVLILVIGVATFGGVYFTLTKDKGEEKIVIVEEAFHDVGEIFVNLNDDKAKRYVKLNFSLGFDKTNEELAVEIAEKQVVMRATAISYIRTCTSESFRPSNEETLKKELVTRINQELTKGLILDVYISDIIVQ